MFGKRRVVLPLLDGDDDDDDGWDDGNGDRLFQMMVRTCVCHIALMEIVPILCTVFLVLIGYLSIDLESNVLAVLYSLLWAALGRFREVYSLYEGGIVDAIFVRIAEHCEKKLHLIARLPNETKQSKRAGRGRLAHSKNTRHTHTHTHTCIHSAQWTKNATVRRGNVYMWD